MILKKIQSFLKEIRKLCGHKQSTVLVTCLVAMTKYQITAALGKEGSHWLMVGSHSSGIVMAEVEAVRYLPAQSGSRDREMLASDCFLLWIQSGPQLTGSFREGNPRSINLIQKKISHQHPLEPCVHGDYNSIKLTR